MSVELDILCLVVYSVACATGTELACGINPVARKVSSYAMRSKLLNTRIGEKPLAYCDRYDFLSWEMR